MTIFKSIAYHKMRKIEIEWDFEKSYVYKLIIWIFKMCLYHTFRLYQTFLKNYSNINKTMTHNASNFKLLRFTIIYIVVVVCLGFGIGLLLFLHDPNVLIYIALITLALFIPYYIFISIFFVYYLLQKIYLIIVSLGLTVKSI